MAQGGPGNIRPTPVGQGRKIKHGGAFDIRVRLAAPVAFLFDVAGAEKLRGLLYRDARVIVRDVEAVDASTVVVHAQANDVPIVPGTLAAIGAAVAAVFRWVKDVTLEVLETLLEPINTVADAIKLLPIVLGVGAVVIVAIIAWAPMSGVKVSTPTGVAVGK